MSVTPSTGDDRLALGGLAPGGAFGAYHPGGHIRFGTRPAHEWEFLATGTGVTGLTVTVSDALVLQVNHSAAVDEASKLRALARIHLDLDGKPFAHAVDFRMDHDLRRSLITVLAESSDGPVRVEIRAHVPEDLILVEVRDDRRTPGALTIRFEEDAPSRFAVSDACRVFLWHENPADAVVPAKPENAGSGADVPGENRAWLAGRVFGLAMASADPVAQVSDRTVTLPAGAKHTLVLAGVSTLGGGKAFADTATERLNKALEEGAEGLIASHESWWREFWARAWFEPEDKDGSLLRHKAAFDLYRYYLACCAGERRETPPRFQIDLYHYSLRQHAWLTGLICAVEQYQSFYGAMRTGDWAALCGLASFYVRKLPYYRHYARLAYGHGGARIPMWQGPVILTPPDAVPPDAVPLGVPACAYNGENPAGQLWTLLLCCDYVDIAGDYGFAREILLPLAIDLVEFIRLRYPRRENRRMVIAPCNAGETWQGVRDPAEMVCALRATLPRLLAVARTGGWPAALIAQWEDVLAAVPEIPRGHLDYHGAAKLPVIRPGDGLAPAADMSACESYVLPWSQGRANYQLNAQQTELYAIWPAKLVLQDKMQHERAARSYRERLWPHKRDGWNLDVAFAACLGLQAEVAQEFGAYFDHTCTLPCGLARETAPTNPATGTATGNWIPESPSLQGMGSLVIPVLEMLLQDFPDRIVVLPCWSADVGVSFGLYSPFAGKVEVRYRPGEHLEVKLERALPVSSPLSPGVPLVTL